MGINVCLQDEMGRDIEEVDDLQNLVVKLLPAFDDPRYHVVNFIDPYGHTVLNQLQMTPFLDEWERIADNAHSTEAQELHARVKQLASPVSMKSIHT